MATASGSKEEALFLAPLVRFVDRRCLFNGRDLTQQASELIKQSASLPLVFCVEKRSPHLAYSLLDAPHLSQPPNWDAIYATQGWIFRRGCDSIPLPWDSVSFEHFSMSDRWLGSVVYLSSNRRSSAASKHCANVATLSAFVSTANASASPWISSQCGLRLFTFSCSLFPVGTMLHLRFGAQPLGEQTVYHWHESHEKKRTCPKYGRKFLGDPWQKWHRTPFPDCRPCDTVFTRLRSNKGGGMNISKVKIA